MDTYTEWLIEYFSRENDLGQEPLDQNIYEADWIDSFGTIVLIEELESGLEFRFSEEHFQDRRFSTIRGIAEIIKEIKVA